MVRPGTAAYDPAVTTALPARLTDFLARPNPAVMGTVAKDGRPVTVVTWYLSLINISEPTRPY